MSLPQYSTDMFHYDKEHNEFGQEASSLQRRDPLFGEQDGKKGITLISARTGKHLNCFITHIEKDREGDIQFWKLNPDVPQFKNITIIIFND